MAEPQKRTYSSVYNALKQISDEEGIDFGLDGQSEEQFKNKYFTGPGNINNLYNKLSQISDEEGVDFGLGTRQEWLGSFGFTEDDAKPKQGYKPTADEMAGFQSTINSASRTAANPTQSYDRKAEFMKKRQGLNVPQRVNLGESNNLTPTEQHFNPETGEMEQSYMTGAGNEYDNKAIADMEQRQIDQAQRDERYKQTLPGQLEDAYAERDRINEELAKYKGEWVDQDGRVHYNNRGDDETVASLEAALRQNQQRITALEAERDEDGGTQFWRGFIDAAMNPSVQSFGLTDFNDMMQLMRIKNKVDKAKAEGVQPQLTPAEQQLMESSYLNNYAQSAYGDNRGFMYRAGGISMQALPFVAEFMMTGGFGALSQKGAELGTRAAEKLAIEGLKRSLVKNLGVVAGDVAAGWAMANTTGLFRTAGDVMSRNIGQVAVDENGEFGFEGGKSIGRSLYEAEVANTLEYYTEKLGEHLQLGKWLAKGADKMGLSKLSKAINYLSGNKWLERGGIQDYPSEVVEEQANLLLNAMLVGDNNFSLDPNSKDWNESVFNPKTQADIWGGMMLSIGLMQTPRLAATGYNAAGYYAFKKNVDTSDTNASIVFGRDNWDMIKEQIDNCDNEQLPSLLESVVNGKMTDEQKTATMNYAGNLLKMRGYNMGMMAGAKEEEKDSPQDAAVSRNLNQNYMEGHQSQMPDEMKLFVDEAETAGQNLLKYGEEFANMVTESENPVNRLHYMMNNRDYYSDEEIAAAADYYLKNARAQGVMDAALDNVDLEVEKANAEVRGNTHQQTGSVVMAKGTDDLDYYIIGGDIVTDPETGLTSLAGTGGAVVVKDPVTGEVSVKSPQELIVYSMQNADDLIQRNEIVLRQQLVQQADDDITYGSPANEVFDLEDIVTLQDGNGGLIEGQVVTLPNAVDGVFVIQTADGRALQMTADDMNRRIVAHNGQEVQRNGNNATENIPGEGNIADQNIPSAESTITEPAIGTSTPESTTTDSERADKTAENEQHQSALSRIPVRTDDKGQPMTNRKGKPILDWHKASVEDAAAALVETTAGNMVMARDTASDLINVAREKLEKIRKQKPKGEDPIEIAESRMEIQRQIDEQQAIIKQWQDVGTIIRKQMESAEAERRAAEEAAKSEEQRQREAEEARIQKERQDEADRQRIREQIEKDREKRTREYDPVVKAREELQGDNEALALLDNIEPQSLEEHVSSLLRPHSMLWQDASESEIGLQSELGLKRADMQRMMSLLGTKESGAKPFGQVVLDIHEGLPEAMKDQYTDEDVRNTLLNLFNEGSSTRMMHLTEEHRIEEARQMAKENERRDREAEMEAWAEFYHLTPEERETFEDFIAMPLMDGVESEIINQIIADNEQNRKSSQMVQKPDSGTDAAGVEGGEGPVRQTFEAPGNGNSQQGIEQGTEAITGEPPAVDNTLAGAESVFGEPKIDVERSRKILSDLTDAYASRDPEAIQQAADALKTYINEGGEFEGYYKESEDDYEGEDPQILARQYMTHVLIDRYLDDDEDQEYIRTGLRADLRDTDFARRKPEVSPEESQTLPGGNSQEEQQLVDDLKKLIDDYDSGDNGYMTDKDLIEAARSLVDDLPSDSDIAKRLNDAYAEYDDMQYAYYNENGQRDDDGSDTMIDALRSIAATKPESQPIGKTSSPEQIAEEEAKVDTNPSEAQKEAGNYQKGHINVDGYDITIENPKGSIRRGIDRNGDEWEQEMHNTYGYIRGTEGVDGDHIDVFLSDNPTSGQVFVVDQVDPETGMFDEHKVMYGFADAAEATQAYLSNYEPGWKGLGAISGVSREAFKEWVESSHRKTKPFRDYALAKQEQAKQEKQQRPSTDSAEGEILVKGGTILKNNIAGGDAVALIVGSNIDKKTGKRQYLVEYYTDEDAAKAVPRIAIGDAYISQDDMRQHLANGNFSTERKQEKPAANPATKAKKEPKQHKRIVSDDQMEELRKKLLDKFNNLNAGIDVERMLLGAMYAVGKIERGVTKFADYAQQMVDEIGDVIRPYLKAFYNAVRDMPEAAEYRDQMDSPEDVEAFDVYNFDKQAKVPDAVTKAEQVVRNEKAKKQIKKVKKQLQDGYTGSFFDEEEPAAEPQPAVQAQTKVESEQPQAFRPATQEDLENAAAVYYKGKKRYIMMIVREGSQADNGQFEQPRIVRVVLTNGESANVEDLFVEDTAQPVKQQTEQPSQKEVKKPKTAWWNDSNRPQSLDPNDYRTYMTDEAKKYFANYVAPADEKGKMFPDFTKWAHPNLAYITAAAWDGANIPVEKLMEIPEIAKAEARVKAKETMPPFRISEERKRQHVNHLLDDEHGSAVFENGKIKKVKDNNGNEKEVFTGPVRQENKAFVVVGRPAGGKSSVFANRLSYDNGARIVDSDVVKPWLSGYDEGYGAGYVQATSADVASSALKTASDAGDNIVLPRIGGGSVMREVMMLREKGYDVQIFYNEVSEETSIMRAASRFAQEGRYLSLDYLTQISNKDSESFRNFATAKLSEYYDKVERKESSTRTPSAPVLLAERGSRPGNTDEDLRRGDIGGRGSENVPGVVSNGLRSEGYENGNEAGTSGSSEDELIFSYAEWKSNDVPFGEKPKEIWNSRSGKPMPGKKEETNNETKQKVSGKPESAGEGTVQASGTAERTGTERSPESDRAERSGSGYSVDNNVAETQQQTQQPAKPKQELHKNKRNNVGERGKDYAPLSPKARFNANVEAIKMMRALMEDGVEAPTKDQMEVLRQYSGWGGLGTFFNDESLAENKLLRDLLSEDEYNDAVMSINSAYFTPAMVIDSMWDIAKEMGFKGGTVLEGSAGIGNIIGQMPKDMSRRSDIEAVEIDKISGNILKLLYPDAKVNIQGFQDTMIPNGSVDLAITNVPFVTGLHVFDKVDKDLSRRFTNIHDFCIAKNIRKLREGGIGIFISSSGTLDKSTDLRQWITDEGNADVVGAFRLNNKTFGGTTATSDIIVVRKRTNGQKSDVAIDIRKATPMRVGSYEDKYGEEHQVSMVVNDYFKDHPEMMAGEMAFGYEKGETFRPGSYGLYPVEGMNQEKMLNDFVKSMGKAKESAVPQQQTRQAEPNQLTAEKEGRMLVDDKGRICVSRYGTAWPLNLNDKKVKGFSKEQCFKDYQAVQKAVDDVLQQQLNDPDDSALKPKLDALNKAYDTFVKRYGTLHKNTAISFLRNDIDFPSFLALENYSETKDMKGKVTVLTKKAPLFTQRVLGFKTEPKPKTVKDALIASIFRSNGIDLDWIAKKLNEVAAPPNGKNWTTEDVKKGILVSRLGFENPATGQLEVRHQYLSGNVREKLAQAESYNTDGKYNTNIEELQKVVPMDIPAHLIDFSLGSSWIPNELYTDYLKTNYGLPENTKLTHVKGQWVLDVDKWRAEHNETNKAKGVYSQKFRANILGSDLVEAALNNRPYKVAKQETIGWGSDKTTKTIVDQEATSACNARIDEIKDEFKQFIRKRIQDDNELARRIEKIYNDKFNALVPMRIDDEMLPERFEDSNKNINLYDHQKRGVMRGVTSPTMLAHEVGTGKSFTLISTAMEMRRLGTAKKPMIVVQNATVAQMTSDAKLLYPNAKVLSLSEQDRDAEGRRAFYAKIKFNDWDMIIIPQSTLDRIPDSPERELQFIQEQIDEKKHLIEQAKAAKMDKREIDKLERDLAKKEQEYGDKYLDSDPANDSVSPKRKKKDAKREAASLDKAETKAQEKLDRATDDVQFFDDLGVDAILVDEAHGYKHLGFETTLGRSVKGVDPSFSKKCAGLYNKTRSVFEKAGWKNVVFATGTPISNTAAEIWTFMKYLMPADVMKANDIYYFDDFVHNFGSINQMLEFKTNGKFNEVTRFAAYVNRPELMRIWMQVADIVRTEEVGEVKSKVPEKENGKDQDVFLPQSPSLIGIMAAVRAELERFENMDGKEKKENSSIPLTMYGIAKRAAIDPRLVNPDAPDEPMSKTNAAVKEILKDLDGTKKYNGTVAVFCDNQNRLGPNGVVEFNIFEDMKSKLVAQGVPEEQIAIIKSSMSITAKQKIFDKVNTGEVRVVLGSTQTLGTGVNIQERLHLLIHMDAPDRPMDYTQRNGRIERQGNLHREWGLPIRILRFGVEDSLDVTAYQRLKTKSGFIDSIMNGKSALANNQTDRTIEEEEEGLFDNPVAVLSGSQFAMKKNQAERELRKLQGKYNAWEADQIYVSSQLRTNSSWIKNRQEVIADNEKELQRMRQMFPDGKVKEITVDGVKVDMTADDSDKKLSSLLKEKINDPVNAIVKRNRENQIYNDETLEYTVYLDGHAVNFKIDVTRSNEWDNNIGKMRTVIHKNTSYTSPDLHLNSGLLTSSKSVKEHLDDIIDQYVSGRDYQEGIESAKRSIERVTAESAQLKEREGQPFQLTKELSEAKQRVAEYTELMKKELEEKEAKYAQQQKESEENSNFDLKKAEEIDDEDVLYSSDEDWEENDAIYTDTFKDYFGDWESDPENASKVVDENGLPMIVYHGTNLTQVNRSMPFYEFYKGSHFGTIGQARTFVEKQKLRMDMNMQLGIPMRRELTKIYPVYLNIRNPKRVSDTPSDEDEWDGTQSEWWDKQIARSKAQGYDGIVYLNEYEDPEHPADSWIAFYPEQVKSAEENIGTYDSNDPDIRHRSIEHFEENETFPINVSESFNSYNVLDRSKTFSTELMPDEYASIQQLLDALRVQYPEYYVSIEDGNVKIQSWNEVFKSSNQSQKTRKSKGTESYVERKTRNAIAAVQDLARRMNLDVEVLTTTDGLQGKKARSKGWFNPKTGKITIVLPNHTNKSDVLNTLLHEGVAHFGLRKMFGQNFEIFLDNVYENVSSEIKARIDAAMKRNKWGRHEATEEYLARLAERTDFERATEQGWWRKIKNFFYEMLVKSGFTTTLTDNELRYILWRSYENLVHPDSHRNVFDLAKEIDMQRRLNINRYVRERDRLQRTGKTDTSWMAADKVNEEMLNRDIESVPSQELLLSLSQKEGEERNETVNELVRRVREGDARIVRMGQEVQPDRISDAQIAGTVIGGWELGLSSMADGTLGEMVQGRSALSDRSGTQSQDTSSNRELPIISWAKSTGHYYDEEQVKNESLDKDVWKSGAESRVYRTADGKKVIKFMESWVYYKNPLLKHLDDIYNQNSSGFEPLTVIGYSLDNYGKLQIVIEQNFVEGETVDKHFKDNNLKVNDYIDVYIEEILGLERQIDDEGNLYHTKNGLIYRDIHGGNVIIGKDGQNHIIDCNVTRKDDDGRQRAPGFAIEDSEKELFSIRTKEPPKKTGKGYKVFVLKDGQLYPPMVANPNGEGTPVGVWLDADAAPISGESKTGRPQVKAGGKGTQGGSGQLAYRPGWHLGTIPYALQFNRKDANGERSLFPNNFVWAEVEYADDVDYQEEARQQGVNANGKYQHSLAGLKHIPTDGSYKYRTNPDPKTDEWVISGAMRVNRILSRKEVDELVKKAGRTPQQIQDGDVLDQETVDKLNAEITAMKEADDMGLLYRDDDSWQDDVAQQVYEKAVAKDSMKWQESWQDSMASLKAIQDAIAAETGNKATGAEDAYHFENRMHGRAKNMTEQYDWKYYRPMLKAFSDFCKSKGLTQKQGMEYLISKSGLERNVYYALRNGAKEKVTDEINDKREKLDKKFANGRISEDEYNIQKAQLEEQERNGVDDFMKTVRESFAYQHAKEEYENGNISYSEYLRVIETVIRGQLKRNAPKKDAEGHVVSDNYYDDYSKDYSGLTETFAKEWYDDAQAVKKEAQRTIDPKEKRALWSQYDKLMREAYMFARQFAEDAVFAAEEDNREKTDSLWNKINAATKETLRHSYESGLIDRINYNKVRAMFDYYIPLRGWDEDKASDVYTYMGKDNVFSPAVKKTWGRTSKAENPLAYIGNIAVSTILSGHRNQMKQHFLNYVLNNPTSLVSISESWYENIAPDGERPVWILRTADTAGKSGDEIAQIVNDFNEEMQQKQREGKAMPVRGRLRLDVHATQGQKSEHVVEVQRAGHTYQLYINGNPKAAQALNGSAARAVSRISDTWLGKRISDVNRSMAAFFTSKNPAFVVSNLSRDLNMAGASVAINEGSKYNKQFVKNVVKVLAPRLGEKSKWVPASKQPTGLMPSLMRKWKNGTLKDSNETERYFKEFMNEGGETGFVNMLSVDSFKDKMKKEVAEMNGSSIFGSKGVKETSVHKALRLLGETFEFYNRCAEDATRFIVYMTSRQMGKSLEESIADAKDVTLNFNRKGTGGMGNAEVRDLFIFVNPAIQALANMYRMAKGHSLKFGAVTAGFVTFGALMPVINQWLLNMFGDDDDKDAYWNLPPWIRKNNLVFWIPFTKNFVTIPLAQEFRVFYGVGEMMASAVMDHPVDKVGLEVFSSVADLVPINPTGNGGNLMVDFAPTMVQPLMQIGENIDFTGKPIWKENQGNEHAPMYSKAYISTPTWMVKLSEEINNITGGNEGKKGAVEKYAPFWGDYINNPAVWNHLLQGYFGGMYNTIAKTFDVGVTAAQGELPKIYQTPVINRFLNRPVERDNAGVLGEEYYNMTKERDALQYELRVWQKKAADGEEGAQEHVDEILSSDEWKRAEVISHYEKIIKDLKAGERSATESVDKADIKRSISLYKQQMMEELEAINEGKDPLDAAVDAFGKAKTFAEKNKLRMRIDRLMMRNSGRDTATNKTKGRNADVSKALSYISDEDKESRNTNENYLSLATAENIRDDARIRAAKARIKAVTDEYKKMLADGRQSEATKFRQKNAKYFAAETTISSLSRAMNSNKKLLGKGSDQAIMRLIDSNRNAMLKAIENI